MSRILETRRIFETVKKKEWVWDYFKNPHYNEQEAIECHRNGYYYEEPEYLEKEVPKIVRRKRSHIEYRIKCAHCGGTNGWVRRKDAKFCTANCRSLHRKAKKE